jgi:hypothetical protein
MKFSSRTIQRPLSLVIAAFAICGAVTFALGDSKPDDSDSSVSQATNVFDKEHADNPQVRIAINHVLGQSQSPLLIAPSPPATAVEVGLEKVNDAPAGDTPTEDAQAKDAQADGATDREPPIVFGNAGASSDGWRPAHLPTRAPSATTDSLEATELTQRRFQAAGQIAESTPATTSEVELKPADAGQTKATPVSETKQSTAPADDAKSIVDVPVDSNAPLENNATESQAETRVDAKTQAEDVTEKPLPVVVKPVAPPLPPLTQNQKNLRAKVRRVIKSYYTRPLNSRENDPWELMHGMLAYGVKSQIRQGGPQGKPITLVGWMCYNRPSKGFTLLYTTPENQLRAKQGVGLQGHMGQFLAMLAQCQVSPEYPIRVRDQEFTVQDLIEAEKVTCYPKSELTFKLIALMHYLDSSDTWVNDQGQSWDIPRLIREELSQPIRGAACGGTHRLSGLSLAARTRVQRGEPLDGEYLRAAQFVDKYQSYAFQLQNRDGSLSTEWFRGRGDEDDTDRRVKTTGHILEWLCYSVPDKDLRSAKTFRAANYLASLLANDFNHEWEVGPLGHAIHALRLYDERMFQPYDGLEDMAKKPARKTAKRPSSSSRSRTMNY